MVFRKTIFVFFAEHLRTAWRQFIRLSGGLELGDSLGSLGDGVLCKLSREEEADSSLDLTGREGGLLVVSGKLGCLKSDSVKDIVDERVEDGDASLGDTGLRVNLLEDLVDVRRVAFDYLLFLVPAFLLVS